MIVNHDSKEAQFKIVYCGTPLGGKTTNLNYIYGQLDPELRGDLVSIASNQERTLFFDFLPVNATEIAGYETRFQLYTVPGQHAYANTREVVLQGVDGIVFVADSDPARKSENRVAYKAMMSALATHGLDEKSVPIVTQFNKRDLENAMAPEEMDEALDITTGTFLACATTGYQVFATLDTVTQAVLKKFHDSQTGRRENQPSDPSSVVNRDVEPLTPKSDQIILSS